MVARSPRPGARGGVSCCLDGTLDWSDHWAFWREGYPLVMLTDTPLYRYAEYHGAADRPEVVNPRECPRATHGIVETVRRLVGEP